MPDMSESSVDEAHQGLHHVPFWIAHLESLWRSVQATSDGGHF